MHSVGEGYQLYGVTVSESEVPGSAAAIARPFTHPSPPFGRVPSPADAGEERASKRPDDHQHHDQHDEDAGHLVHQP